MGGQGGYRIGEAEVSIVCLKIFPFLLPCATSRRKQCRAPRRNLWNFYVYIHTWVMNVSKPLSGVHLSLHIVIGSRAIPNLKFLLHEARHGWLASPDGGGRREEKKKKKEPDGWTIVIFSRADPPPPFQGLSLTYSIIPGT